MSAVGEGLQCENDEGRASERCAIDAKDFCSLSRDNHALADIAGRPAKYRNHFQLFEDLCTLCKYNTNSEECQTTLTAMLRLLCIFLPDDNMTVTMNISRP